MTATSETVRQSVTLPARVAKRVRSLARERRTSASRILLELIESGLEAKERERQHFHHLVERLAQSTDPAEQGTLKEELARLTFGH